MIDIDFGEAERFLRVLDAADGAGYTWQTFDDYKDRKEKELARIFHGPLIDHVFTLMDSNAHGAGVYVTVNETDLKGRTTRNIARIRAVWQDDDEGHIGTLPLEPSIVVQSSRGKFQRYWLVEGLSFEEHAGAMARMVADYGSDPGARGLERVLRLPGFWHCKGEPFLVRMIDGNWQRYSREEILAAFPPMPPSEWARHPRSRDSGPGCELDRPGNVEAAREYLCQAPIAIEGKRGDFTTYKVCATTAIDYALSERVALSLLLEYWNPHCVPPWSQDGLETKVRNAIAYARGQVGSKTSQVMFAGVKAVPQPAAASDLLGAASGLEEGLEIINGANVVIKNVSWLWEGKFANGKLGVIAGDPGVGKSQVTLSIAATVTTGGKWPVSGQRCEKGRVLLFSSEDDIADTIVPRLIAAGGDRAMLDIQQMVRAKDKNGKLSRKFFDLSADLRHLEAHLEKYRDIRLVIIDPITAYFPRGLDGNSLSGVRSLLAPLGELIGRYDAALIAIQHPKKGTDSTALNRLNGSIALGTLVRTAWMISKDADDPSRRLFLPAKTTNGPDGTGLAYSIEGTTVDGVKTSRVRWEPEAVLMTADEALGQSSGGATRSQKRDEVAAWIMETLKATGPISRQDLLHLAAQADFSQATFDRAAKKLSIVKTNKPGAAIKMWSLAPTKEEVARAAFANVVALPSKMASR